VAVFGVPGPGEIQHPRLPRHRSQLVPGAIQRP
jgi:hypothetical protein